MRWSALAALAAVLIVLGGAGGTARADVATTDGITPASVSVTLGKGSSTTINSSLHLNALPPKADVLLALDTTGSMGAAIADAKSDANALVTQLQAVIPQTKFAVAEFKDYGDTLSGTNAVAGLPWRVAQDFTDNSGGSSCEALTPIACALGSFSAGGGGDEPEAYNTAFYEAAGNDPNLHWDAGASRFMIVLGDSLPHDAALNTSFPDCPNTGGTADRPPGVSTALTTLGTLGALKTSNTNLSFVTYNDRLWDGGAFRVSTCHGDLATFTGGSDVTHDAGTAALKDQIVNLVNASASQVDNVTFNVTGNAASWVTFFPSQLGPISAPADVPFSETVTVPAGTAAGTYTATVHAVADGADRGSQQITVNVTGAGVSALSMSSDEPSIPAGIASVPYGSIPGSRLSSLTADVNSGPAGSLAAGSIAAGSIAAGSIAAGSIAAGSIAAGSIAAGSIAAGSIGFGPIAAGSIAAGSIPSDGAVLRSVLLSQIPLVGTTWADILKDSPFANQPLQAVTLYDVANYGTPGSDGNTPWQRLMALPLRQVPFFQTLWRSVPLGALLLGNATIGQLPPPKKPDGTRYASWSDALTANGGSTTGVSDANTVFGLAISGNLGTTNVGSIAAGSIAAGSIAAGSIAAGSIAAGSIAAGSIDLRATTLGPIPLTNVVPLADIVDCNGTFSCTGKTLGDASAANAILPNVTLATLLDHLTAPYNQSITIDSIAQGILAVAEYPWEQINVQGLQDIAGTGQNVHYHVDFDLVCSVATSFSVHVKLPKGFFPAAGSSKFSYAGGTPQTAADPTLGANGPVWSTLPGSPCGGGTATRHVRLDFTSYSGLTLGSQTSDVDVTANGGTYAAANQAPVLVTQNWEPSDNADTAPTIDKNTLIVGHIATGSDVDFYRFPVTGLAPGTKVTVYLKVPRDADLDLVVNRPGAPGVASAAAGSIAAGSIAAGSIAAGSIPLEDTNPSVDNSNSALQPDAAADLAAGSIAAGSIAAGSISANRGTVNEAAQIVTRGETGAAVIGVSGYNSAFSNDNYVLRVKVTPPPTLPPCPAVTGFGTATPGSLIPVPSASDPSVHALFLVDRQRLMGLYPSKQADIASLLDDMSSPLNAVASQVGGKVLQIDGDQTVRNAYQAWDTNPCSIDAANTVVRSINNLVASYRPKYPNLKYVVLLGTDTVLPSWRQQDLTSTSPEVDEANDLAFTTSGLTQGNALYAASAQNAYLTDQAYGAFKERVWLGHDIPLADVSVSRLVETPDDIVGQLRQYLAVNGRLNPQSALTTGESFFSDGAQNASDSLGANFGLSSANNATLISPTPWTHQSLLDSFFQKSGGAPDIGALWAHYSHWLAQPAQVTPTDLTGLATTGDVAADAYPNRLLFTVGCHSALNVPDTIATVSPGDQQRLKDWAQAYMAAKAAVYIGNTGFGYGDTDVIDLSERLMDHFAATLNTGGTIGEQWVQALHRYYSEPSNYDVIDEKVMVEANMYGLPFYDFGPAAPGFTPTVPGGSDTVQLPTITANVQKQDLTDGTGRSLFVDSGHPDRTTYTDSNGVRLTAGTLAAFYRPTQPTVSRDVTIDDPNKVAHGAWISSLATHTIANVKPVKPFPLVFSPSERPVKDYPNIFFPANVVTVNRDSWFGQEHDTAVVNLGKFIPNDAGGLGTEQVVDSIGLQMGYSASADVTPPLITQVGAVKDATGFTLFVHVTDAAGLARVAALWAPAGSGAWNVQPLTNAGGGLWTAHVTSSASSISLDGEAEDTNHNVGFSFNKAVHFQSFADNTTGPSISVDRVLPNAVLTLGSNVASSFSCSDPGGVASCLGATDGGSGQPSGGQVGTDTLGQHTFTVTATDLSGNRSVKQVTYFVVANFSGFQPPVDNPPIVNIVNAGSTVPVKWSLTDSAGNYFRSLSSVTSITSTAIKCDAASTDPAPDTAPAGLAGLKYDLSAEQFVYNWPTLKAWKGTCRRLYVGLVGTGVLPYADFKFK
ncbi:MAG TPA: PxKF domain-containing protein [Gaiellaceae bacterium]|nr:PxKF domain-containing protein [Gaiellaceae bacterium]